MTLKADGFDGAILGCTNEGVLVYSVEQCINILIAEGLSEIDAIEHMNFNVIGAYVGDYTPIFIYENWQLLIEELNES